MRNTTYFNVIGIIGIFLTSLLVLSFEEKDALGMMPEVGLKELKAKSDSIVRGKVVSMKSEWNEDGSYIWTFVDIKVSRWLKNRSSKEGHIVIKIPGGTVGNITQSSSDEVTFERGEEVLLFLHREPTPERELFSVVDREQGKFTIKNGRVRRNNASAEYALLGSSWAYQSSPMGETIMITENTSDTSGALDAILNAMETWDNAGADFRFAYGGNADRPAPKYDGVNQIRWIQPSDTDNWLAITTWWSSLGKILEADMAFNDKYRWATGDTIPVGSFDVESVALHELGHVLGLGHSSPPAVMQPTMSSGLKRRILASDDINGVLALYGVNLDNNDNNCVDADDDGFYATEGCGTLVDCDDNDHTIYPGATELCDGKDNNCDGRVDEGCCTDNDGDGYYSTANCGTLIDCNDNDPTVYPGAPEPCDGKDNNCDGEVDEGCCTDNDGDGYYAEPTCGPMDCDDEDPTVNPEATELCDGTDNNCNGYIDEGCNMSDLTIKWLEVKEIRYYTRGKLSVKNVGQKKILGRFYVNVYLSEDEAWDEGDTLLKAYRFASLKAGYSKTLSFSYRIRGQGAYLIAVVDPTQMVEESNEDNNLATALR